MLIMRKPSVYKAITTLSLALACLSCANTSETRIPTILDLKPAMGQVGMVRLALESSKPKGELVVIKDRHSTQPGNHRLRPQLRQVQKDNRRLVEYLIARGFDFLGCEQVEGELQENPSNRTQYRLVRKRIQGNYDLDELAIYQPILFQSLWSSKLTVCGVEDAKLFSQDLEDFKQFVQTRRQARRNDLSEETKKKLKETLLLTGRKLKRNIQQRGKRAAEILLQQMDAHNSTKAILMIGGAHVPAAIEVLKNSGFNIYVFESSRY